MPLSGEWCPEFPKVVVHEAIQCSTGQANVSDRTIAFTLVLASR